MTEPTADTKPSDSTLERIRRTLALASDENTTEEERELAMSRALAMMSKYAVDDAMVRDHSERRDDPMVAVKVELAKPHPAERVYLLDAIAGPLDCRVVWQHRARCQPYQATIYGRRAAVERVEWLWTALQLQLAQGFTAHSPEEQSSYWKFLERGERTSITWRYRTSWSIGFRERVSTRLWIARRDAIDETPGAALVLRDRLKEATDALTEANPGMRVVEGSQARDSEGYLAGHDAANDVDLGQTRVGANRAAIEG